MSAITLFVALPKDASAQVAVMQQVYTGILDASIKNLDQILLVASSLKTQISDADRLEIIHAASQKMDENYSDLKKFNTQNANDV